jgi:hypothetical protein
MVKAITVKNWNSTVRRGILLNLSTGSVRSLRGNRSLMRSPRHEASLNMEGRSSVEPGFPGHPRASREPQQTNAARWRAAGTSGRPSPITELSKSIAHSVHHNGVICVGSCVLRCRLGSPGLDGVSPYHTNSLHPFELVRPTSMGEWRFCPGGTVRS